MKRLIVRAASLPPYGEVLRACHRSELVRRAHESTVWHGRRIKRSSKGVAVLGHLHGYPPLVLVVGVVESSCDTYLLGGYLFLRIYRSVGRDNFHDVHWSLGVIGVKELQKHLIVGRIDVGDGIEAVSPSANISFDLRSNFVDDLDAFLAKSLCVGEQSCKPSVSLKNFVQVFGCPESDCDSHDSLLVLVKNLRKTCRAARAISVQVLILTQQKSGTFVPPLCVNLVPLLTASAYSSLR